MTKLDPDAELLPRIARGDQSAILEIVTRKLPRLLALGTRMLGDRGDAEDIAQETFLRVWKHAATWQPDGAKFDTWLHRVALNLCYDRLRQKPTLNDQYVGDEIPEQIDSALIPEARLNQSQQGDLVASALALLPVRQREALVLQYYQEFSNIEAAGLMGISIEAFESLLSRARRNLRASLLEKGVTR